LIKAIRAHARKATIISLLFLKIRSLADFQRIKSRTVFSSLGDKENHFRLSSA
jgi:hypothetical protein